MYLFEGSNHTFVIGVPIANYDNTHQAANENLRLHNLWDAIQSYPATFTDFADDSRALKATAP
jgi:hypothetical protein